MVSLIAKPREAWPYWTMAGLLALPFLISKWMVLPAEDAVILFEYAKNLRETGIITYGGAGVPIEGATDFLWMIMISLLSKAGISEFGSSLFLNYLGAIMLVLVFPVWSQRWVVVCGLFLTPFLYSSLCGFSTIFFCAIYLHCLSLHFLKSDKLYAAALLLCLIRPDGVVWAAGPVCLSLRNSLMEGRFRDEARVFLLSLILPGVAYFLWRCWYFNEFLPLPFLVKSSARRDLLLFFKSSVSDVAACLIPALLTVIALATRRDVMKTACVFIAPVIFYCAMNLEQNIGNRFLAPLFFGFLLYCAGQMPSRAILTLILATFFLCFPFTSKLLKVMAGSRYENFYHIANDLSRVKGRMLLSEAGRLSFYSGWQVDDSWGLNTPRFAHRMIAPDDIRRGNYDLIVAHCDLAHLRDNALSMETTRSWDAHCKALLRSARDLGYSLYIVPEAVGGKSPWDHFKENLGFRPWHLPMVCMRHDLFAVGPHFENKKLVEDILKKHEGVMFTAETRLSGEMGIVCR